MEVSRTMQYLGDCMESLLERKHIRKSTLRKLYKASLKDEKSPDSAKLHPFVIEVIFGTFGYEKCITVNDGVINVSHEFRFTIPTKYNGLKYTPSTQTDSMTVSYSYDPDGKLLQEKLSNEDIAVLRSRWLARREDFRSEETSA